MDILNQGEDLTLRKIFDQVVDDPSFDHVQWAKITTTGTDTIDKMSATGAVRAHLDNRDRIADAETFRLAIESIEKGGTRGDYLDLVRERLETIDTRNSPDPYGQFIRVNEMPFDPPSYLIDKILESGESVAIVGKPGSYKSFVGLSMVAAVATGADWYGRTVQQGPAFYIAAEGQSGIRRRLKAWEIVNNVELSDFPLLFRRRSAMLTDPRAFQELKINIDQAVRETGPPRIIVLDTLNANFGPGHESDTGDMTAATATINRLRHEYDCTVLILHHPSLSDPRRGRGSTVQIGNLDREYILEKDGSGVVRLEASKTKDDAPPPPLAFRFSTVELGILDSDGRQVTSGVLSQVEYTDPQSAGPVRGAKQKKALVLLSALIADHRENLSRSGRDPDRAHVSIDRWRDTCTRNDIDRRRFSEVKRSLSDAGLIRFLPGEYVEITETGKASDTLSDRPSDVRSAPLKGGADGRTRDTGRKPDISDANRTQTGQKPDTVQKGGI